MIFDIFEQIYPHFQPCLCYLVQFKPSISQKTRNFAPTMAKKTDNTTPSNTPKKRKANSGSFSPGHEKMGGRKAGTPNKMTRDARQILGDTLLEHLENVGKYLTNIDDDAKRVQAIASLLPFYMPKYQSTTLTADTRRSLSCEEEMCELDKQFASKEIEITITEREIFNFDDDDIE